MDYADTVALFRCTPLFASMDPASLRLLAFSSTLIELEPGDILCTEGEIPDGVFIIQNGEVEVVIERSGRTVHIATLGHHEVVGEIAVILNQYRSATVVATTTVKALRIDAEIFMRSVTEHPDAALSVMRMLSSRIVDLLKARS